jgi:hypothetical protein
MLCSIGVTLQSLGTLYKEITGPGRPFPGTIGAVATLCGTQRIDAVAHDCHADANHTQAQKVHCIAYSLTVMRAGPQDNC